MILGDYHTHTAFSHGKGSVEMNAAAAVQNGLKELAITDHGFGHICYNVSRREFCKYRRAVADAREHYPDLRILLGMETNILDGHGRIDLKDSEVQDFDIILCGYHKLIKTSPAGFFSFSLPLLVSGLFRKSSKRRTALNTDAFIKAMERYPIAVITHPNFGIATELSEVARAAADLGVYMEINGKRVTYSAADTEAIMKAGAKFIVNSDAHSPGRVGDFSLPLKFIEEAGIQPEFIANLDKLPVLRRCH